MAIPIFLPKNRSKDYGEERAKLINWEKNDPKIGAGDPYPFEGKTNPYRDVMKQRGFVAEASSFGGDLEETSGDQSSALSAGETPPSEGLGEVYLDRLLRGTTSIEAADKEGWVVSVT